MKKDIHILCKAKDKMFVYIFIDKKIHWITKEKKLSIDKNDRAFVSSWDKVEKLIDMLDRGEI